MSRTKTALLAFSLLAGVPLLGGIAQAQRASTYDPAQLPEFKGKVAQYTLTPRGDVDGLLLADGTEVHVPPHVSTQLVFAVKPGDAVTIHGLKARAVPMIAAMSLANDATGATVMVQPPQRPGAGASQELSGRVKSLLHEPRGEVNGVLLDNGGIIRLPPPEATRLAAMLAPGQTVTARGDGYEGPLGRVVAARQIGPDAGKLTQVAGPGPRGRHAMMGRPGMAGHDGMPGHGGMPGHDGMPGRPDAPPRP